MEKKLWQREREKRQEVNSHTEERGTEDAGAIPPLPSTLRGRQRRGRDGGGGGLFFPFRIFLSSSSASATSTGEARGRLAGWLAEAVSPRRSSPAAERSLSLLPTLPPPPPSPSDPVPFPFTFLRSLRSLPGSPHPSLLISFPAFEPPPRSLFLREVERSPPPRPFPLPFPSPARSVQLISQEPSSSLFPVYPSHLMQGRRRRRRRRQGCSPIGSLAGEAPLGGRMEGREGGSQRIDFLHRLIEKL